MGSDPKREAGRWLDQAEEELGDARDLMEHGRYYRVLFLA